MQPVSGLRHCGASLSTGAPPALPAVTAILPFQGKILNIHTFRGFAALNAPAKNGLSLSGKSCQFSDSDFKVSKDFKVALGEDADSFSMRATFQSPLLLRASPLYPLISDVGAREARPHYRL